MNVHKFYQALDAELEEIITDASNQYVLQNINQLEQKKGYALLIWFLKFYGPKPLDQQYITDGPGDYACDIIFSNNDTLGKEVYYVVQSKWSKAENTHKKIKKEEFNPKKQIEKEEFNAALTDFNTILQGVPLSEKNEKFQEQYKKLIVHLKKNGKAKFVFFALRNHNPEINSAIEAFNETNYPNISLEVIDINRLKRDYIERNYKGIITDNPLDPQYELGEIEIEIDIEHANRRTEMESRNIFVFDGSKDSYIFAVKPKTIYDMFKKYKYNLFFKNVRNPLPKSGYNQRIVETLLTNSKAFWYFNNGITAIAKSIPPIGKGAKCISIKGLQIINGAQTVHAIYQAYEEANEDDRKMMDDNARITLRLMESSDDEFTLEITRFTNSQNEMEERDFVSNEAEQKRLQEESFNTNYWYEKRRGEFITQKITANSSQVKTKVVANKWFALAYMAFYLQKPIQAYLCKDKLFVKAQYDKDGRYEEIFTSKTSFTNMLAAYLLWEQIEGRGMENNNDKTDELPNLELYNLKLPTLALSRIVLEKYLSQKYPQKSNDTKPTKKLDVCKWIIDAFEDEKDDGKITIAKVIAYSTQYITKKIEGKDDTKTWGNFEKLLSTPTYYESIKEKIEEAELPIAAIDAIANFVLNPEKQSLS